MSNNSNVTLKAFRTWNPVNLSHYISSILITSQLVHVTNTRFIQKTHETSNKLGSAYYSLNTNQSTLSIMTLQLHCCYRILNNCDWLWISLLSFLTLDIAWMKRPWQQTHAELTVILSTLCCGSQSKASTLRVTALSVASRRPFKSLLYLLYSISFILLRCICKL